MLFFKAESEVSSLMSRSFNEKRERDENNWFSHISESFFHEWGRKIYIFMASRRNGIFTLGIFSDGIVEIEPYIEEYAAKTDIEAVFHISEITGANIYQMLNMASRYDYIPYPDVVIRMFDIDLSSIFREITEIVAPNVTEQESLKAKTQKTLYRQQICEEIDRIFSPDSPKEFFGHPVHYIVQSNSDNISEIVGETLIPALYANNRLSSRRYCLLNVSHRSLDRNTLEHLFKANIGGTVILEVKNEDIIKGNIFRASSSTISELVKFCDVAKQYSENVLTILCLSNKCINVKNKFYECLENLSFVEITETNVFFDEAKDYLTYKAAAKKIAADNSLYEYLKPEVSYNAAELDERFNEWYISKMTKEIYPQYNFAKRAAEKISKEQPQGNAYEELKKLIGLSEVKNIADKAIDYYKAQKLFEARGMKVNKTAMHMVFTGNPGTAKTTVARLFAQIMKDNKILSVGNLVEVGRAELVGKYVGWTAQIVKNKFKEAKGSVLFIDEAYSLLDGEHNTFGTEAINTIVAEMENNRDDIIVIFAGYPKEMEEFLAKNPGMSSRIAFHVPFEDYNAEELYAITELMAEKNEMILGDGIKELLIPVYEEARKNESFGNGRFVRNIIEKAVMNQGSRLVKGDVSMLSNVDLRLIKAEDITLPEIKKTAKTSMGFVV